MATRHTVPRSQGFGGGGQAGKRRSKRARVARPPRPRRPRTGEAAEASLVARVSHELRTPLHAILSLSQLLLDEVVGPLSVEQRKYLEVIDRNGQNLLRLTRDLLDLSRIQAGALPIENRAVDIGATIAGVAHALSPLAVAKQLALTVAAPVDLPRAWCDAARVEQVLTNLVGNAIKFTAKGYVRVAARRDPDATAGMVRIDVVDTGVGISADARARIFDQFFQADPPSGGSGWGLGLALARGMAQLMGGALTVDSAPGAGTRFSLALPVAQSLAGTTTEEGERGAHPSG